MMNSMTVSTKLQWFDEDEHLYEILFGVPFIEIPLESDSEVGAFIIATDAIMSVGDPELFGALIRSLYEFVSIGEESRRRVVKFSNAIRERYENK